MEHNSHRYRTFCHLLQFKTGYSKHYETISTKYASTDDILSDFRNKLRAKVYPLADKGRYKYSIYVEMNPDLLKYPYIDIYHPIAHHIIKFRMGNHYLPIETGRWRSIPHEERFCSVCGVIGDEKHVIYDCSLVPRDGILLNQHLHNIWFQPEIFKLFGNIKTVSKFLQHTDDN